MAKGIAVLSPTDGSVVHKLMNDKNAIVGGGGSAAVTIKGSVKVEDLAIATGLHSDGSTLVTLEGGTANNDLAEVMNAIENTMDKEIIDSATRRSVVDGKVDDLIAAAGLTTGTTAQDGISAVDPTLAYSGTRYLDSAATLKAADEALSTGVDNLNNQIDDFLGVTEGEDDKTDAAIALVVDVMENDAFATIAQIKAIIGDEQNYVQNVVTRIAQAFDDMDGEDDGAQQLMNAVETALEAERDRRKGNKADSATVGANETGDGIQGNLQWKIDQSQLGAGHSDQSTVAPGGTGAAYMTDTNCKARDAELDAATATLDDRLTALEGALFDTVSLSVVGNGTTDINGHMKMHDSSQFSFPVLNATEAALLTESSEHNGKVFYLNVDETEAGYAAPATHFADGARLYFCENAKWHSSYNLNDKE
jgi:hypothetical protein